MCLHTKIAALRATQSFFPCAGACTYNITLNQLQNQISSLHSWMNQSNSSLAIWYNSEQSTPQRATPDIFLDFGFYFFYDIVFSKNIFNVTRKTTYNISEPKTFSGCIRKRGQRNQHLTMENIMHWTQKN